MVSITPDSHKNDQGYYDVDLNDWIDEKVWLTIIIVSLVLMCLLLASCGFYFMRKKVLSKRDSSARLLIDSYQAVSKNRTSATPGYGAVNHHQETLLPNFTIIEEIPKLVF